MAVFLTMREDGAFKVCFYLFVGFTDRRGRRSLQHIFHLGYLLCYGNYTAPCRCDNAKHPPEVNQTDVVF